MNEVEPYSLTDTHTHIYYAESDQILEAYMQRCAENRVDRLLLPNVDRASIAPLLTACQRYPEQCLPMMGLHPGSVAENYLDELKAVEEVITRERVIGIGEIGLDLYWDASTLPLQMDAFRIQIGWAKSLGLPVSIHCRNAYNELMKELKNLQDGRLTGVLHCFTGDIEQAKRLTGEFGLKLGIGGIVTFKNAGLDKIVQQLNLQDIVLETDSPYLAPAPYRGKKNESSYLKYVAEKVADLHEISLEELASITTQTASHVFQTESGR